jgi:AMIN domain
MKAVIRIICATALLVTSSARAATVNNVELSYEQGYTVAKIYVDGDVRFTHQSEIAKDGKPYRIIVDILTASHNLGGKVFTEVPACAIKGIRSSQFAVKPEQICRVVFDMVGETVYRTEQTPEAVVLYISDGFSQPFTNWSSKSWVASANASKQDKPIAVEQPAATEVAVVPAPITPSEANALIADDRLASLQSETTVVAVTDSDSKELTTPIEPVITEDTIAVSKDAENAAPDKLAAHSFSAHASATEKADTAKPVDSSQVPKSIESLTDSLTPEPWAMQVDFAPIVTAPVVEEPKSATSPDVVPTATQEVSESQLAPELPNVSAALVDENPGTAVPADVSTKVHERTPRKKSAPISSLGPDFDITIENPFVEGTSAIKKDSSVPQIVVDSVATVTAQPAMLADAEATTIVGTPKPAATDSKPASVVSKTKMSAPKVTSTPKKVASGESKSSVSSEDTMASEKPSPSDVAPAVDTSSTQPTNVDDKNKGTARFRRDPITSKKMRGTLVAEFPQRLVIQYKGKNGRDPFETLIDEEKQYNTPVEKRVPNVEGLILVGVIETGWGDNRALFEDRSGHGFIMQSGDKVQKGYVLRVEKDRVYFQLFEYGWSRTVSITLEDE